MIERMSLGNFKGWEVLPEARFGRLTGFFGLNSAGKSSLIQLLLLMKQTVESTDRSLPINLGDERDARTLVNLGTFKDMVFGHDTKRALNFTMTWKPRDSVKAREHSSSRVFMHEFKSLKFAAQIGSTERGDIVSTHLSYQLDSFGLALDRQGSKYELTGDLDSLGLKKSAGRKWDFPAPTKCYGFPDRIRTDFQNPDLFLDVEQALESFFIRDLFYLGPLRFQPERSYTWSGGSPEGVGHRGENVIAAILASRASDQARGVKPQLELTVARWLKKLGLVEDFALKEMVENSNRYEVKVRTSGTSPWVDLPDVGFGVSQVLPVLTLCYYVPRGATIILEHPEIHLHPAAQTGLADVILDAIRKRDIQVIVESHSEHFLRRLQRRVAEGVVHKSDIELYFCTNAKRGGRQIEELKLNLFGEIENWPTNFFGNQLEEVFAIQEEGLKRRLRGESHVS